jgi:hypothetical protein
MSELLPGAFTAQSYSLILEAAPDAILQVDENRKSCSPIPKTNICFRAPMTNFSKTRRSIVYGKQFDG